jgi:ABC-type uncharacterized transport system permease subunit
MILASDAFPSLSLSLMVAVGYLVPAVALGGRETPARLIALLAWLMHAVLLVIGFSGDTPHFGFAAALSVTVWLIAAVYAVESHYYPQLRIRWSLCALGSAAVLLAQVFPGAPLPASTSVWLPLHWALGIASYGLFGVAVAHAWYMGRSEDRMRRAASTDNGMPLLMIERLTFRFVGAGFVLLTATLLVAFVFRESLYGRGVALRWDHKTIFSILSWVTFAALLLGRARFGWRGRRAVRMLYAGAGLLFLAYVGSRFVMEVVLGRMP